MTEEAMKRIYGSQVEQYKDFIIYPSDGLVFGWEFVHKDYDGPEDGRCGHTNSLQEAKDEIDERFYED